MARFSDEGIKTILLGRRAVSRVPFPLAPVDSGLEVGIRSLSDREIDQARMDAQGYLEGACKRGDQPMERVVALDRDFLDREHERQIIALSCVDPDDPTRPFFDHVTQVRELDSVMVRRLWQLYLAHIDTVNPYRTLTDAQVKGLVDALKKEPKSLAILEAFERDTLISLLRTLVSQPPT